MKKGIRERMIDHIRKNAKDKKILLDCIDGYVDHLHALVSLKAEQSISKIAQHLKGESSHWANEQRLTPMRFEWQDEYFAISVGDSAVHEVREYIRNQEEHHRKKTFLEEYRNFLIRFEVEYDERYIFKELE